MPSTITDLLLVRITSALPSRLYVQFTLDRNGPGKLSKVLPVAHFFRKFLLSCLHVTIDIGHSGNQSVLSHCGIWPVWRKEFPRVLRVIRVHFSGEPRPIVNFYFNASKWRPVVKDKPLNTVMPPNSVTFIIEDFRFIVVTEFSTHRSTPPTFSFLSVT